MISIVIPTYHRKKSLLRLLKSLDRKNEIIVVEQGENNKKTYKKYIDNYVFLQKPSTPHAMNIGVKNAKEDLVLFLDDDVTVTKNFWKYHEKNFKDTRVAATVGRVITDGQPIEPERMDTGSVDWIGSFSDGFSSTIRQEVDTVIGANTCWSKDVFLALGGFDERFCGNALRFESDLSLRAKKAGYKIIFEPKALVYHRREATGGARKTEGRIRWYIDYFKNELLFFVKHRPVYLFPIFIVKKMLWVITNL